MAISKLSILIETLYKGAGTKAAEKDLKGLEGQTEKSTQSLGGMRSALGLMATSATVAGAAMFAAKKAFDLGAEGAQLDRTRDIFNRLSESIGETSDVMIGKLRNATMGMVSDTELMKASARTMSMGLASTGDEAAKLAEIAVKLGSAMGKEAGPAMEEFGLLLANQSTLRLDTFGISAARVKERIQELTIATPTMSREVAFMTATMEQAEISMANLGDAIKPDAYSQMAAEMGNITDELKILASKGLGPAVSLMSELLREARKLSDLRKAGRDLNAFAEEMGFTEEEADKLYDAFLKLNEGFERNIDAFSHKGFAMTMKGLDRANKEYAAGLKLVEEGYEGTAEEIANYVRYNEWVIASQKRGLSVIEGNVIGVENLTDSWMRNIPVIGEVVTIWDQWLMSLEAGINPLDSWGRGVAEITEEGENIIPVLQGVESVMNRIAHADLGNLLRPLKKVKDMMGEIIGTGGSMFSTDLGLFNQAIDDLGPALITWGGRTADQNRILNEATGLYDRYETQIVDIAIGVDGLSMSEDERAESIGELIDKQSQLNPLIDEMGNITGSAAWTIKEATVNQDALNEAFFKGANVTLKNREEMEFLAVALGGMNEQQAAAYILQWELMKGIEAVQIAYNDQTITAGDATDALTTLGSDGYDAMMLVLGAAQDLHAELDSLPLEKRIKILIETSTTGPTTGQLGGPFAPGTQGEFEGGGSHAGADFTVPPGYPNDSYPMRVESGEHVQVTPKGQGKGGGDVYVTVYTGSGNADLIGNKVAGRVAEVLGVRG